MNPVDPTPITPIIQSASAVYDRAHQFIFDINYALWASNIKTIFFLLTILFLGIAIFAYIKGHLIATSGHGHTGGHHTATEHEPLHAEVAHQGPTHAEETSAFASEWEKIQRFADSLREPEWKLSVIEADRLVDHVLKSMNFPGETMGERLMMIKPDQLGSLQELWDAHKLRNLMVHDANYHANHNQVLAAIRAFESVLRELGVLS